MMVILIVQAVLLVLKVLYGWDAWEGKENPVEAVWKRPKFCYLSSVVLGALLFLYWGLHWDIASFRYLDLLICYGILAFVDGRRRIVPNRILVCYLAGQFLYAGMQGNLTVAASEFAFGSILTVFLMLLAAVSKEKIGYGDIKLIGVTAVTAGWRYTFQILTIAVLLSFIYSLWLLIFRRRKMSEEFPFVPFLFIGLLIYQYLL